MRSVGRDAVIRAIIAESEMGKMFRSVFAMMFLLVAIVDYAVPCCGFGEDGCTTSVFSSDQSQIHSSTTNSGSDDHGRACDQCYSCSHFNAAHDLSGLRVILIDASSDVPPLDLLIVSAPGRGLDRPPRTSSLFL